MLNFKLINFLIVYIFFVHVHDSLNEIIDSQRELDNLYLCDYKCGEGEICIFTGKQNNVYKCIKKEENRKNLKIGDKKYAKKIKGNKCKNEKNCEIDNTDGKKIPKSFLCDFKESKKCNNQICLKNNKKVMCLCASGKKFENNKCTDITILNKKCPEQLCDPNAACFLNETKNKFKCICNEGYWGFGNVCFPLKNELSSGGKKNKNEKKKKEKNDFTEKKKDKKKEEKKKKENIKESKENLEITGATDDSVQSDKIEKIQNPSRKGRILEEACKLDCGEKGKCVNTNGYEKCTCEEGYGSDPNNNFKCTERCKINNGGCDPEAICEVISKEDESTNGYIQGIGIICKCKNGNTKYNGYYCSSSYLIHLNFFFFILLFLFFLY